ncbi:MAG: glycosyltransferase family 2 protein [Mycoplasma sp.]
MKIKLSIIIPSFNTPINLFENCLKSLQKNQFVEIIIVDDCSSNEKTLNFLKKIKRNDVNVIFLDNNSGAGVARNIGVNAAIGDFILFLDSDDFLVENGIKILLDTIDGQNFDIYSFDHWITKDNVSYKNNHTAKLKDIIFFSPVIPCSKIFSKSFLTKNNISFPATRMPCEDEYYWLKCLMNNPILKSSANCIMHYVKDNPNSVMTSLNTEVSIKSVALYWSELSKEILEKEQNQLIYDYFNSCVTFVMSTLNLHINKLISKKEYNILRKKDLLIIKKFLKKSIYKFFVVFYYSNILFITIPFNLWIKILKFFKVKGFLKYGIKLT